MTRTLAAALLLLAGPAHAQHVFKCVDARGAVSYQSHWCENGQMLTRLYRATPDSKDDQARAQAELERRAEEARYLSRLAGTDRPRPRVAQQVYREPTEREKRAAACADAKRDREATLKMVGLARTFDLLRTLDLRVYEACIGL